MAQPFWLVQARVLPSGKAVDAIVQAPSEQRARVYVADELEDEHDGWLIDDVLGPRSSRQAFLSVLDASSSLALGLEPVVKSEARRAKAPRPKKPEGRRGRRTKVAEYTPSLVSAILAAEIDRKFRVEFVLATDATWCLLLCHYRYCKAGWALATEFNVFDGGAGSGMRSFDIPSRVPKVIRAAYAKAIRNWKALATEGKILDQKWYEKTFARSHALQQRMMKEGLG